MPPPTIGEAAATVFGYLRGLHATHYLDLGIRMGLFSALAKKPQSADALARDLGLHPPYVRGFCEMGHHLEILDREGTTYGLAPEMDRLLASPDDAYFLGGFPQVHLSVAEDYRLYPELFRSGAVHPYQEHSQGFLEDVAGASRSLPRMFLDVAAQKLPDLLRRLEAGGRVLDVGCGAGHALATLAERFPSVTGVGIEIEPVSAEMARALLRSRGLAARIDVRSGWEPAADFDSAFDVVTQFLVLHEIRPELKDDILARCARALRPGGTLVLFDEAYPEDAPTARDPIRGFAVVAQWFELTWGNVINTRTEILDLVARAGLRPGPEAELSRFRIVTAIKA
ncbi:MAG TPA: class I SAM-dependent methyltransferase [Vicinamibacteria bacterium]|nr:class I SAM-dependent methyltransferase [Vicinamibacteria bacterium]